jgi:hypothetical protein
MFAGECHILPIE